MERNNSEHGNIKEVIEQLWYRARINSLAHKESMYYFGRRDTVWYIISISTSLLSILFIICGYIYKADNVLYTILSILFAFFSFFSTVFSNHKRYGFITEEHKYLMNSYLYISQRSREAKLNTKTKEELEILLDDLQRDFSLLKVRGLEPSDEHFDKAHKIVNKVKKDPISSIAQSFDIADIHSGDDHTVPNK